MVGDDDRVLTGDKVGEVPLLEEGDVLRANQEKVDASS